MSCILFNVIMLIIDKKMQNLLFFNNNISLFIGFQTSITISLTIIYKDILVNDIQFTIVVRLMVRIERYDMINIYFLCPNVHAKILIFFVPKYKQKIQIFILFNLVFKKKSSFPIKTFVYSHEIKCKLHSIFSLFYFLLNQ